MGCLQSKKEVSDLLHPNLFRVMNIDEEGSDLWSGQLEITESDIILYRDGRDSTVWPLHSLRRYGFEDDVFSFESGRRCETGEGIYAFRCRRASTLFRILQQHIQLRNVLQDSSQYPASCLTPPQTRPTLQATVIHRSSVDNGQPESGINHNNQSNIMGHSVTQPSVTQSPHSPSSADILEVMPLYPRPQKNSSHVTNLYQLRNFKKEHNNNQAESIAESSHVYSNDLNRDLAMLRNTLRQEAAINTMRDIEDETRFLENRFINESICKNGVNTMSPTLGSPSDYAQLNVEQQEMAAARMYMNIVPNDIKCSEINKKDIPQTPLTPKLAEYCNLPVGLKSEINMYANLSLGEISESVKTTKQPSNQTFSVAESNQKFSESDTFTSISPVDELINYAVLDIDSNKELPKLNKDVASPETQSYNSSRNESTASGSSQPRGRIVSQTSLEKTFSVSLAPAAPASVGYTTIDFDKTVALTSVAVGTDNIESDGPRKTRHNSTNIMCGSPKSNEKNRISH